MALFALVVIWCYFYRKYLLYLSLCVFMCVYVTLSVCWIPRELGLWKRFKGRRGSQVPQSSIHSELHDSCNYSHLLTFCPCLWTSQYGTWIWYYYARVFGTQVDAMDLIEPMVSICLPLTEFARLFIYCLCSFCCYVFSFCFPFFLILLHKILKKLYIHIKYVLSKYLVVLSCFVFVLFRCLNNIIIIS